MVPQHVGADKAERIRLDEAGECIDQRVPAHDLGSFEIEAGGFAVDHGAVLQGRVELVRCLVGGCVVDSECSGLGELVGRLRVADVPPIVGVDALHRDAGSELGERLVHGGAGDRVVAD